MSNELKSSPKLGLVLQTRHETVRRFPFPGPLQGTGPAVFPSARHVGSALYAVIAAFSAAPSGICRPKALRGILGSLPPRVVPTKESMGTWEAQVQMGETF